MDSSLFSSYYGGGGDPYATSYDSSDDDEFPSKKTPKTTTTDNKSKPLPPIHFVPATADETDHHHHHHPPSFLAAAAYCYSYYEPPLPPEPGSLASNKTVAKMMSRMNYEEGTGLGKYGHGIIDPIETSLKYKKGGLGTVELGLGPYKRPPVVVVPGEEADRPNWADEAVDTEPDQAQAHGFADPHAVAQLRREGEAYATARARERRHVRARAAHMRGRRPGPLDEKAASAKTEIIRGLGSIRRESESGNLTLGGLIHEFTGLKERFPEEYRAHRLGHKAIRFAAPLLPPLVRPRHGSTRDLIHMGAIVFVKALRELVDEEDASKSAAAAAAAAFDGRVGDVVLTTVEASSWDPMEPQPMLRFVNTWKDTLAPSTMGSVLEKIVMPALVSAAENWSPGWWSSVPAKGWVSPWIPHFGHGRLRRVYNAIGIRLGESMCKWGVTHNDYHNVSPWKEVFDTASWDEFVLLYVVPLVRKSLGDVKISPKMCWGKSNPFPLVMEWACLVPVERMVPLLESEFFGKWRDAVHRLVMGVRPSLEEAIAWYETWKGLFTPELLAQERVLVQLEAGLDMINRAALELEKVGL